MSEHHRLRAALRAFISGSLPEIDYHAHYAGKVLKCHGDLHLDVQPDTDRLPPFTRIPLRIPFPGMQVKIQPGARVLVAFAGGSPEHPYVSQFESGTLELLVVTTGEGLQFTLDDDRDGNYVTPFVELQDGAGSKVRFQPKQKLYEFDVDGPLAIKAKGDVTVTSSEGVINLGGAGGKAVALHGDAVASGSVVATSTKVKAV